MYGHYECISVGGSALEVTSDTDDKVEPTLWFKKKLHLLLLFHKVSCLFIVVFGTYLSNDEMMIRFSGRSLKTHIINNKPLKEGHKWFVLTDSIKSYIVKLISDFHMVRKKEKHDCQYL